MSWLPIRAAEELVGRDYSRKQKKMRLKAEIRLRSVRLRWGHSAPPAKLQGSYMSECT